MPLNSRRPEASEVTASSEAAPLSSQAEEAAGGGSNTFPLLLLLLASTALHLVLALHYPLSEDETYYWDWSRNLDWGYYDQGPMIALWIRAFCSVFGETVLGVRAGAIVAALGIQILGYWTLRSLFGARAAFWGVLTLTVTPLSLVGGFVFTYDSVMILFWALAVWATVRILQGSHSAWIIWGLALGLGLLSKLTMALVIPCTVLFLLSSPEGRDRLRSPWPWIALLIGFGLYVPNLLWQATHDWVTFDHVRSISQASQGKAFYVRMGDFLGSQVAVITPILIGVLIAAMLAAWRRRADPGFRLLWAFGATVLVFFLVSTLKGKVLGNWAAAGWYSSCLLAGPWLVEIAGKRGSRWFYSGVVTCGLLSLVAVFPEVLAAAGLKLPESINRPSNRMFGGEELAQAVLQGTAGTSLKVAATEYQQVSRLNFYLPGHPRVLSLYAETRRNDYMLRAASDSLLAGDDVLLVLEMPMRKNERAALQRGFVSVDETPREVPIYRRPVHEEPVRTYYLYRAVNFDPVGGASLLRP